MPSASQATATTNPRKRSFDVHRIGSSSSTSPSLPTSRARSHQTTPTSVKTHSTTSRRGQLGASHQCCHMVRKAASILRANARSSHSGDAAMRGRSERRRSIRRSASERVQTDHKFGVVPLWDLREEGSESVWPHFTPPVLHCRVCTLNGTCTTYESEAEANSSSSEEACSRSIGERHVYDRPRSLDECRYSMPANGPACRG